MMVNGKIQTTIMVVDDQDDITWSLSQALSDREINTTVITASSGEEALDNLLGETIHLLITDITMLEVDDLDLFLEIKKKYPAISVIVMTAFPSAEFKKEAVLGENLFFVEKPFDMNKLKQQVIRILTDKASADISPMPGISITDIIQLKCLAGATTTLQINKGHQQGVIQFKDGEIIHAVCGKLEGEEAFHEILNFGKGIITTLPPQENVSHTISIPCMTMIRKSLEGAEAFGIMAAEKEEARKRVEEEETRKKAEEEEARKKAEEEEARNKAEEEEARKKAEEEEAGKKAEEEEARKKAEEEEARKKAEEEEARKKAEEEEARKKAEEEEARKKAEEEKRKPRIIHKALKDLISSLKKIEGYIAAGVLAPSGKLLAKNTVDRDLDLEIISSTFNRLFGQARKESKKIGFPPCRETIFDYSEKAVLMLCSSAEANIHFHLMAIMESCKQLEQVIVEMENFQNQIQKELSAL